MANAYTLGDSIRLSAAFTNSGGNAVDPGSVVCTVRKPSGSTTTPSVTKDSTGNYHSDVDLDAVGEWFYRFEGLTSNKAAAEQRFIVKASLFS